ncbi:MAG: hypothetical protein J7L34_02355 [Thermotogaceae bacterium]|nr:hypothetical protein [Thermotogaceae bacterium]
MIFVGFTHQFGRIDYSGIEKYKEKNKVERVVIFCRKAPIDEIKQLAKGYEFVITSNPRKEARAYAKRLKKEGKKVVVEDLQDFGERAIRDVC